MRESKLSLAEVVAIGVGGMVGGGIFAVLGLAMQVAGHAVAIALGLGGVIALLTGWSYAHLGLAFRNDGGSFTYIEHAFSSPAVAGAAGWVLVAGYVGTLALYATTFGAYGAAMVAGDGPLWLARVLGILVMLVFLAINLAGAKASGQVELLVVAVKVAILAVFVAFGLRTVEASHMLPIFDKGAGAPFAAAALIFVAYEGFELIPNAVEEMREPERNLRRGLVIAIVLTAVIYVCVGLVALGNLTAPQVQQAKEYALAVAARPTLGQAGFLLIGCAALLSTASAINATLFGSARLAMVMASERALPRLLSMRERTRPVPWVALILLTAATSAFLMFSNLTMISSFASATFLLIFGAVNAAALRLCRRIGIAPAVPCAGVFLSAAALLVLSWHIWMTEPVNLVVTFGVYLAAGVGETVLARVRGQRILADRPDKVEGGGGADGGGPRIEHRA